MASAAADVDTECPVCHEDFSDAKFLPCFHVACRKCILSWLSAGGHGGCPLCRAPIMLTPTPTPQAGQETPASVVDTLPTDLVTMALVDSKRELSTGLVCNVCDDVNVAATSYCLDCSIKLCSSCTKAHRKLPCSCDHKMEDLCTLTPGRLAASRRSPCVSHANRPGELYCPDHLALICVQCFNDSHHSCVVKPVAKTATQEREALTAQAKRIRDQELALAQQIREVEKKIVEAQNHFSSQRTEVKVTFDRLQQELEKRCQTLLSQLQQAEQDVISPKQAEKAALEKRKASLAVHAGSVERLVLPAPDGALLGMLGQLKARLDRLEKEMQERDVSHDITLVTVTWQSGTITRLEQAIATLGQVASQTPKAAASTGTEPCLMCGHQSAGQTPKPKPRRAELAKVLKVGDRVRRGPDWRHGDADARGVGTVTRIPGTCGMGTVDVKWEAVEDGSYCTGYKEGEGRYRMGYKGFYDLDLA